MRGSPALSNTPPVLSTSIDAFRDESKSTERSVDRDGDVKYSRRSTSASAAREEFSYKSGGPDNLQAGGMRTQVLRALHADSKGSGPSPGASSVYANSPNKYADGAMRYGEMSTDDVLLGTQGVSPRTLQSIQANMDVSGDMFSTGRSNANGSDGIGPGSSYNSGDRLRGLLGSSMDGPSLQGGMKMSDASNPAPAKPVEPVWLPGRCAVGAIDQGTGLDVLISAIQLNSQISKKSRTESIQLQFSFLGQLSEKSSNFDLRRAIGTGDNMLLPTQYSAHLGPGATSTKLRNEIEQEEESLSISVFVKDAASGDNIGSASINIWIMVEDTTNIIRHEIEVYSLPSRHGLSEGVLIGSVYVDVRGFRLLLNNYTMP